MDATYIWVAAAGYLLGSIPTGFLVGMAKGIDVRKEGSGNIGATNAFRILGKPAGTFVLLADALKGYLACTLLVYLILRATGGPAPGAEVESLAILGGVSAILGHNYTCWLRFKGGKGIATSAGVLAALMPMVLILLLSLWGIVFKVTRYVSVASITVALALPILVWATGGSARLLGIGTFLGALAIYKHKANIVRLLNGTENRFGSNKHDQGGSAK